MSPLIHLLLAIPLCFILFPFYGWKVWIVLVSSVLIDIDHPPVYFLIFKRFNIKRVYRFFIDNAEGICDKLCAVFHTVEFLMLILILSFYFNPLFLVFIGLAYHVLIDFIGTFIKYKKIKVFSFFIWLKRYTYLKAKK